MYGSSVITVPLIIGNIDLRYFTFNDVNGLGIINFSTILSLTMVGNVTAMVIFCKEDLKAFG